LVHLLNMEIEAMLDRGQRNEAIQLCRASGCSLAEARETVRILDEYRYADSCYDVDPRSLPEDTNPPIARRVSSALLLLCAFLLGGLANASLPTPVSLRGHAALSARPSTRSLASPRHSARGASDVSSNTTQCPTWPPGANGIPALATAVIANLAAPETERSRLNFPAPLLNNALLNNPLLNNPLLNNPLLNNPLLNNPQLNNPLLNNPLLNNPRIRPRSPPVLLIAPSPARPAAATDWVAERAIRGNPGHPLRGNPRGNPGHPLLEGAKMISAARWGRISP
jgi:hypothetical protein